MTNRVILLGRLVRDAEVRYTDSGKVVAQFVLAVDRPYTSQDGKREADFIRCVLWGKPAETIGNNVHKGQRLLVEGRIQTRNYDDKNGQKRQVTEVTCNNFEFIERKTDIEAQNTNANENGFEHMGSAKPFDEDVPDVPF